MTRIEDKFVVYFSKADKHWIAHGLNTDQLAVGDNVVDAVVDFIRAIYQLAKAYDQEKDIQVFGDAPQTLKQMAKKAKKLPSEIYCISHNLAVGGWRWPKDFVFPTTIKSKRYVGSVVATAWADSKLPPCGLHRVKK